MKTAKLWAVFAMAACMLFAQDLFARTFPSKPIRFVMAYPAGGSSDILAQPIAAELSKSLGQPVVIEYKPGGGSTIAADLIAKSPPDGHTLAILLSPLAINATMVPNLPYDTAKDFSAITLAARLPLAVVVRAQSNLRTVQDLIAAAKANPGKLKYGSTGPGGYLGAEYFRSTVGVDIAHVPYAGAGPAVAGVMAGEVDFLFDSLSNSLAQIREGKLRAIGVSTASRSGVLPQVPTIQESGVPGFEISAWYGIFAAANTPTPIVRKLNTEIVKAMNLPEARQKIEDYGYEIVGSTPEQLDAHMKSEIVRWSKVVRDTGAKPN
jgi:tripartite-type tricarboxylate transporter receptor subunit TctC